MDPKDAIAILESNAEHPDVKAYHGKLYTPERLNPFLDSEAGIKILQPRLDRHSTKAIETFREKSLPSIIDEEVKKRNPGETEEQKRIRKIEQDLENSRKEGQKAILKNVAISKLTELKLPAAFADLVIGADEEGTLKNIKVIQDNYEAEINKRVDAKFKENGRKKPGEKTHTDGNGLMNQQIRQAAGVSS